MNAADPAFTRPAARLVTGNHACALGAVAAGCRFFAGYPITPSSEVAERLSRLLPPLGGVFIQMEDEIASIAAVIGAAMGGAKAMTATSGPGFSLKQENLGYAAAAHWVPQAAGGVAVAAQGNDIALVHQAMVYSASAVESFTGGLGTGAFLAFLMAITSRARATTEYAILSSIFAFSRAVAGWAGGIGAQEMGYAAYFFLTFWLSFPAYLLLPQVRRMLEASESR